MEEIHLESSYDDLKINGVELDEDDNSLVPFQLVVNSQTQCGVISSDHSYDASDPTHDSWNYAGGPGFVFKVEHSSSSISSGEFHCNNTEVLIVYLNFFLFSF